LRPEAPNFRASRARPFPRLTRSRLSTDTLEISSRAQNYTAVASEDLEVPDKGTPLPPNTFESLSVNSSARANVFTLVRIDSIIIGDPLRGVVEPFIPIMVGSISNYDLIQPPVVRPDPLNIGQCRLVCGLQRVNAERIRGANAILCRLVELTDTEAMLWEIDENLVRAPLGPAEEALFIDRRRALHEQLHGKSKARGALAANLAMGRHSPPAPTSRNSARSRPRKMRWTTRRESIACSVGWKR